MYYDVEQTKYVPIVLNKDEKGNAYLPYYLETRLYVDLSDDNLFSKNFMELVRRINDLDKRKKPYVSDPPSLLGPSINSISQMEQRYNVVNSNSNYQPSKTQAEITAIETLKKYIKSWTKSDFHNEEKRKDIEEIYLFYKANCDKNNWSSDIIDIGYLLTDIFDRELEYEKSLDITKQILVYYELSGLKKEYMFDVKYIRKMIGCAYGMAIAKVKSEEKKEELLNQSEKLFNKAKDLCENYSNSIANDFCDKEFLWGMYYSNHGAFLLNKGDSYKKGKTIRVQSKHMN